MTERGIMTGTHVEVGTFMAMAIAARAGSRAIRRHMIRVTGFVLEKEGGLVHRAAVVVCGLLGGGRGWEWCCCCWVLLAGVAGNTVAGSGV